MFTLMKPTEPKPQNVFQAQWPQGYKPFFPVYTDRVLAVVTTVLAVYCATNVGLAVFAFWALRQVAVWAIHPAAMPFYHLVADRIIALESTPEVQEKLKTLRPPVSKLITPDGVELDWVLSKPAKEAVEKKAIVYGGGNGECYEMCISTIIKIQKHLENTSVLFFNPRGVFNSGGYSSPGRLKYDAYTAWAYLINEGYKPENICFVGLSLGGAYVTEATALAQTRYPEVKIGVVNINSFATLSSEVKHLFGNGILGTIFSIFIRVMRLEIDPLSAWKKLKKTNNVIFCNANDPVIPSGASLHKAIKSAETTHPNSSKKPMLYLNGGRYSNCHMYVDWEKVCASVKIILSEGHPSRCSGDTPPLRVEAASHVLV